MAPLHPPRVYIGHDPRQVRSYSVCCASLRHHCPEVQVYPVSRPFLGSLYKRPTSRLPTGQLFDEISQAPMSTEFALARFFVPLLAGWGWVLFCDNDVLWRDDVRKLFALADDRYALMVVKHEHNAVAGAKMDGQFQTEYARKNWSSVMLLNAGWLHVHMSVEKVNTQRGLELHQFVDIPDERIGSLPIGWNWLEGISEGLPERDISVVHYTRGTPDLPQYAGSKFADEWRGYASGFAEQAG